jgi:hypothetical protein
LEEIKASDDLGKLDEKMKIKISRREAKESIHWLDLILAHQNKELENEGLELFDEAIQIKKYYPQYSKNLNSI